MLWLTFVPVGGESLLVRGPRGRPTILIDGGDWGFQRFVEVLEELNIPNLIDRVIITHSHSETFRTDCWNHFFRFNFLILTDIHL